MIWLDETNEKIYGSLILLLGIVPGACSSAAVNARAVDDSRFVQASGNTAPINAARNVDLTTAVHLHFCRG